MKKHYAKRMPIIEHSFGLYDLLGILQGVCCFGPPPRFWNNGGHLFNKKHIRYASAWAEPTKTILSFQCSNPA